MVKKEDTGEVDEKGRDDHHDLLRQEGGVGGGVVNKEQDFNGNIENTKRKNQTHLPPTLKALFHSVFVDP